METSLAEWLRSKMDEAGINQAELARRSKISPGHITKIFNGQQVGIVNIAKLLYSYAGLYQNGIINT